MPELPGGGGNNMFPLPPTILTTELFLFDDQDLTLGGPDIFERMRSDDWIEFDLTALSVP